MAGRRIDRVGPDRISLVSFTGGLGSAAILALAALPALHGAASLILLGAGMLLLDVAVQCGQVANQARIFGLPGAARAREHGLHDLHVPGRQRGVVAGRAGLQRVWRAGIAGLTALASAAALTRHLAHGGPPPGRLLPRRARHPAGRAATQTAASQTGTRPGGRRRPGRIRRTGSAAREPVAAALELVDQLGGLGLGQMVSQFSPASRASVLR